MMHHAPVARLHFNGNHVLVLGETRRQRVTVKQVGAARTENEIVFRGHQQIGLAEHPVFGELFGFRGVGGITGWRAAVRPTGQRGDFRITESPLIVKGDALRDLPRRHGARLRVALDVRGPFDGLWVGHEQKRAGLAGAMTHLAVVLQNRQYVAVVGYVAVFLDRVLREDWAADRLGDRCGYHFAGQQLLERVP